MKKLYLILIHFKMLQKLKKEYIKNNHNISYLQEIGNSIIIRKCRKRKCDVNIAVKYMNEKVHHSYLEVRDPKEDTTIVLDRLPKYKLYGENDIELPTSNIKHDQ